MSHPKQELSKLEAKARKSLSQNFLQSPHWAEKLVDAVAAGRADEYWEIGPGLGALTDRLIKKGISPLRLFEYDRKFCEGLRNRYPDINLVEGDFLEADLKPLVEGKRIAVLSNLPYHLSSPILFRLMEFRGSFDRLVITFQREFAERLLAQPDTSEYGGMTILIQLHMEVKSLGVIPPKAFYPAPKVDSMALEFRPKPELDVPYEKLRNIVRTGFLHRRKKLLSNLSVLYPKPQLESAFKELGINEMARPEVLTPNHFKELTKKLTLALLIALAPASFATQDRNFGLGAESSGRVSAVTAESENPYAAIFNPALLSTKEKPQFAFSTFQVQTSFGELGTVIVDSPRYRTREAKLTRQSYQPPAQNEWLWSAGFSYPFLLPKALTERRAGLGVVLSGPFSKLRTLKATTPYEFTTVRYGTSDAQFKATASVSVELLKWLHLGAGASFFISGAGSSDAQLTTENPTGRLGLEVGFNSSLITGLYARFDGNSLHHRLAFVFRDSIHPVYEQNFEGQVQVREGVNTFALPVLLRTTLYYEPQSFELEWQTEKDGLKLSAGIAYQRWSGYEPAFLKVEAPNAQREVRATEIPVLSFRDTWSPRISVQIPLIAEKLTASAGYQYRPTPNSDLSGATNLLDSDAHALGLAVSYQWAGNEWWPTPTQLSLYAQYHRMTMREVVKSNADFIGGPGYNFSGNSYVYGLTLGLIL